MTAELTTALADRLTADAELAALLGATAEDPRVFVGAPVAPVMLDPDRPAYVVLRETEEAPLRETGQWLTVALGDQGYELLVVAGSWTRCGQVRDRLRALLTGRALETPHYRVALVQYGGSRPQPPGADQRRAVAVRLSCTGQTRKIPLELNP